MAIDGDASRGSLSGLAFREASDTRKVYLAYSTDRPLASAPSAIGQLAWDILRQLVKKGAWAAVPSDEAERPSLYP